MILAVTLCHACLLRLNSKLMVCWGSGILSAKTVCATLLKKFRIDLQVISK